MKFLLFTKTNMINFKKTFKQLESQKKWLEAWKSEGERASDILSNYKKRPDSVFKQIATILNAWRYTHKLNRYCAPHMISRPMGSFSMYTLPRRLREMRELSLVVSKPLHKVVGYALTEQGVKLAKSK